MMGKNVIKKGADVVKLNRGKGLWTHFLLRFLAEKEGMTEEGKSKQIWTLNQLTGEGKKRERLQLGVWQGS